MRDNLVVDIKKKFIKIAGKVLQNLLKKSPYGIAAGSIYSYASIFL